MYFIMACYFSQPVTFRRAASTNPPSFCLVSITLIKYVILTRQSKEEL